AHRLMADKGRAQRATRPPVRWHPPGGALSCQEHGSAAQDVLLGPGCGQDDDDGYGLQVGVGFQLIQDFQAVTARLVQASRLAANPQGAGSTADQAAAGTSRTETGSVFTAREGSRLAQT